MERQQAQQILYAGWIASTLAGLAIALGCTASARRPDFFVEQHEWAPAHGPTGVQLLTNHYDLRVSAKDTVLVEALPEFMETTFAEFCKLMPPAQLSDQPLRIYLFNDRHEWGDFTRLFVPAQAHTYLHIQSGGYMDYRTQTAVAFDIQRDRTLALLAHEGFHQYLARFFPDPIHPWLNEGLATQWEAFDLDGYRPIFTPHNNLLRKNALREALGPAGKLIPLPELLRMHAGDAIVQTGQPTRAYYAEVWSMILFLREGENKAYTTGFRSLLADAGTKRLRQAISAYRAATPTAAACSDGEVIFRHYITENLNAFMTEYQEFARHLVN